MALQSSGQMLSDINVETSRTKLQAYHQIQKQKMVWFTLLLMQGVQINHQQQIHTISEWWQSNHSV
jgi:hypothetical protein